MKLILFFMFISSSIYAFKVDYSQFSTPEELIAYEKSKIEEGGLESDELAEAYIDLGESYLFNDQYELGLEYLSIGYEISQNSPKKQKETFPRVLFGLAVIYANLNQMEESYFMLESIQTELQKYNCKENHAFLTQVNNTPILGPDKISTRECVTRAANTADSARGLISLVPRKEVRFLLQTLIKGLENSAIDCCYAGGVWKACLQPIVNKWHLWNEKWKVFKIPPDPAWD